MSKNNAALEYSGAGEEEFSISIPASSASKKPKDGDCNWKMHFYNVSYTVKQRNSKVLKILKDTCGEFKSGRLTAILGPSGAGKTTMLNVLSGFKAKGVSGHITLNKKDRNLCEFRTLCSYISQDFVMLDLLTVEETLKVSTDLKLPTHTSETEKQKIIDDILRMLNMDKTRNRRTLVRDLSGGERKRLSIGVELVTNPPVMFFDEPTSGLDSVASLQVISYLHRLATDGRIIVCVVHQPSSRLLKFFDDVMVMSHGEILFAGPQSEMVSYFEQDGFMCPHYYNPADFVLEVGSEQPNARTAALVQRNTDRYTDTAERLRRISEVHEATGMLKKVASATSIEMTHTESLLEEYTIEIRPKTQVNLFHQFSVLLRRSFRSMSRNLISVQMRLVMHTVVGALLGIVFWNIGADGAKVMTNSSCIFFMVIFVFFGNAMPSILLCPQDTAVFIREYLNGWYSISAYYAAKMIADIPMMIICPTLFISIIYIMTGQPGEIDRFTMCWGMTLLTAGIGHFYGLVFGSTFDMQMSVFLVPSTSIPFLLFSGFFIRIHELFDVLQPLCDVSFFRYTMEGFLQAIYGYDREDLECSKDFCYFKSPRKFLKELDMSVDRYFTDITACCLWIVALMVLLFFSLLLRVKRAQ